MTQPEHPRCERCSCILSTHRTDDETDGHCAPCRTALGHPWPYDQGDRAYRARTAGTPWPRIAHELHLRGNHTNAIRRAQKLARDHAHLNDLPWPPRCEQEAAA